MCARNLRIARQAQRHCDKAEKVFSDVVDCCGGGLSSVERILTGTKTIADADGTERVERSENRVYARV